VHLPQRPAEGRVVADHVDGAGRQTPQRLRQRTPDPTGLDPVQLQSDLEVGRPVALHDDPAPAQPLDDAIYTLCDYVTPNETEATALTGVSVSTLDDARRAGDVLLAKGAGTALITLGAAGSLLHGRGQSVHIPPYDAGPAVETTGAGDAFNGAFAAALTSGRNALDAAHFASAAAGISVTRPGTAPSMPRLSEIVAALAAA